MKDRQDAYGHQLWDYFTQRKGREIVERDDGFVDTSTGPKFYLSNYQNWPDHEKKAIRYGKGRVLDVGCGGGRASLYLQRKGLEVVGIDISPLAVKVCRQRGLRNAKILSLTDIGPSLGKFDTILMFGNNFGLFAGPKQTKRLLKRLHKMTNERALIIAESNDPYQTKEPFHLAYHKLNRRRGRMAGQLRIRVRYKRYATPWFFYLIVSKKEMKKLAQDTGWRVERFIDSKGSAYVGILRKISRSS